MPTKQNLIPLMFLVVPLALSGCQQKSDPPGGVKPTPASGAAAPAGGSGEITQAARDEAKEIFGTRCTPCHGPSGGGDGPASAGLTPKPANFQSGDWQSGVTDEHIEKIIKYGGAAVGKSPMMPANPDLGEKDATVAALRDFIRHVKK